jgi:hypothetical protein
MLRCEIGLRTVTTDFKVKSFVAAVVTVVAVTLPVGARAANLPAEFSGFWIAAATLGQSMS